MPQRHTRHLAAHVISVLKNRQGTTQTGARQIVLDFLLRAVLQPGLFDPALIQAELRGFRLTVDAIIDTYMPLTAHRLGDMWVASDIDFAQVTIGALRLQGLLAEASEDTTLRGMAPPLDLSMLIVVPEGEQHFLGASVVAAQLRRMGCHVATAFCERNEMIVSRILFDRPNAVLFTCARSAGLETIAQTVFSVRNAIDNAPLLVLGGALPDDDASIVDTTNVDLVTNVAKDVVTLCLKQSRAVTEE